MVKLAVPVGVLGSLVATVRADVTSPAPGVTELGEKVQEAPAGRPLQERVTGSSTAPLPGLTVTV